MIPNIEFATITKVVDTRDFHALEKAKVDESYFFTPEAGEAYRMLRSIYHNPATAGDVPSRELLRSYFPVFQFWESTDTLSVLVEQLRRAKIAVEVELFAQDLTMKVRADPMAALASLQSESPRLVSLNSMSEDYSMARSASMIRERYNLTKNAGGIIGIPYPWECLNTSTQGMREENFIVIYGRPKSMKTWLALKLAAYAYTFARRRVLFYSREMPAVEIIERAACILAEVDYQDFMNGQLPPDAEARLYDVLETLGEDEQNHAAATGSYRLPYFIVTTDNDAEDAAGASWLQAKIEELDPDIAFVDGMYLMRDDRTKTRSIDWKNITHISQDMKSVAKRSKIPIVGITQAKRGAEKTRGEDLTELSYADAIGQSADAVYRIIREVKIDPATKQPITEITMMAPGMRSGVFNGMVLHVIPGHTFRFVRAYSAMDVFNKSQYEQADSQHSPVITHPRLVDNTNRPFHRNGMFKDPNIPIR